MSFFFQHYTRDLKEGEELIAVIHKHLLSLLKPAFRVLFWGFLPVAILAGWISYGNAPFWLLLLFFIVLVAALSYAFFEWFTWYNDVYILTTERIIDIEQKSLFYRTVSETTWDKVQDITYEVKGVFATLFDLGNVVVQTAGAKPVIEFTSIAHPEEWQKKLMAVQKAYEEANKEEMTAEELVQFVLNAKEKAAATPGETNKSNPLDIKKI